MDKLFLKIYEEFTSKASVFTELGLDPIKTIDMFRGQPLNPEQFEYFELPALFIDWRIVWTKAGKTYNGEAGLDFHLVTDATWDTSNISTNRVEGLRKVIYHTLVRAVLDNLDSENTGKLQRADETPVDTGVVNYHLLKYTCTYYDPYTIGPDYIYALAEELRLSGVLIQKMD